MNRPNPIYLYWDPGAQNYAQISVDKVDDFLNRDYEVYRVDEMTEMKGSTNPETTINRVD